MIIANISLPAANRVQAKAACIQAWQTEEKSNHKKHQLQNQQRRHNLASRKSIRHFISIGLNKTEPAQREGACIAVEGAFSRVDDNSGIDLAKVGRMVDWHLVMVIIILIITLVS